MSHYVRVRLARLPSTNEAASAGAMNRISARAKMVCSTSAGRAGLPSIATNGPVRFRKQTVKGKFGDQRPVLR